MPRHIPEHVRKAILSGNTHLLSRAGQAAARKRVRTSVVSVSRERASVASPIPAVTVRFDPTDPIHVRDAYAHAQRHKGVGWGDDD